MELKDLIKGELYTGFVVCKKANTGTTVNGKPYCDLDLFGGETSLMGKIWDHSGAIPYDNSIIKVKGVRDEFNGRPQLIINQWRYATDEDSLKPEKFLPVSKFDRDEMMDRVYTHIDSISDSFYGPITRAVYDFNKELIYNCPAAMGVHQAYLGGLMEHKLAVLDFALDMAKRTPNVNLDLLKAGTLLHDIGKIRTYEIVNGFVFQYTMAGKLLEHVVLGNLVLQEASFKSGIPIDEKKYILLQHMITSHQGKLEWGAPVEPACHEAFILHQADNLDAKLWGMDNFVEKNSEAEWMPLYRKKEFYVGTK